MALDSARLIGSLHRDGIGLDLKTVDLCFLVALFARARQSALSCFDEETVVETFEQICELIEPGANPNIRATHSIQRLRDQRLLARVDGAGVVRAGEYTLTTLANAIVEFFLHDEALTRESLSLLTKTLLASLSEIKATAMQASGDEEWRLRIVGPLRVTVGDLVSGIERRQRGLDAQQEEVQRRIGELLQAGWFDAVDRCQALLDDTTTTLVELNAVLLHDTNQMQGFLQEVEHLASLHGTAEAEQAAQRVSEQVDRVAAWGSSRQRAWSDYYQYVHRFLRDVVRLDPRRALSERLRNQIAGWTGTPFFLITTDAGSIRIMREAEVRVEKPAVVRPKRDRDVPLIDVPLDVEAGTLEDYVQTALREAPKTLSEVVRVVLSKTDPSQAFLAVGRIAEKVALQGNPESALERPWMAVSGEMEIEDWNLRKEQI
jgi:chromosome partition protein MukF